MQRRRCNSFLQNRNTTKIGGPEGNHKFGGFTMTKTSWMLALILLATLAASAQDASKKDAAPKPALSPSQAVLESWNDVARKLTTMAEDFPEDKYDFKPNPAEASFAEQLLHAAGANYFFINPANGEKLPPLEDPKRDQFKDKAA